MKTTRPIVSASVGAFSCAIAIVATGCGDKIPVAEHPHPANVEVGYARAITHDRRDDALAIDENVGFGNYQSDRVAAGLGAMTRGKLGANVKQIAMGPMTYVGVGSLESSFPVAIYATAGAHLLQFESVNDSFAFGMFSPVGQVGVFLPRMFTTLAVATEYDVRFTPGAPNVGYVTFLFGFGFDFRPVEIGAWGLGEFFSLAR